MKKYEIKLDIWSPEYVDQLILGLVWQGYNVYIGIDKDCICFNCTDDEVTETYSD